MTLKIEIDGWMRPYEYRALSDMFSQLAKDLEADRRERGFTEDSKDEPKTEAPLTAVQQSIKDGTFSVRSATDEERAAVGITRERGKPALGRARRTKEEIAEDEAAERAEAEAASKPQISTNPENRIDPQDEADEKAEEDAKREPEAPLTIDDVKNAVGLYVNKFGMDAVQTDGPLLFVDVLGKPPANEPFWRMSILPTDQDSLKKLVTAWQAAAAAGGRYKAGA